VLTEINLTKYCESIEPIVEPVIPRDNLIELMVSMLDGGSQVLLLDGPEGIGKTSLLVQFANKYSDRSICSFIKPTCRWTYKPDHFLIDICSQINAVVGMIGKCSDVEISTSLYNKLTYKLHSHASRINKKYYFIVDGIDEIPIEDMTYVNSILELLPVGLNMFKFILTGNESKIPKYFLNKLKHKSMPIVNYTYQETITYFEDLNLPEETLKEIHGITSRPGGLAGIRRVLSINNQLDLTLQHNSGLGDIIELEWNQIDLGDLELLKIIAVVAFDKKPNTTSDVCRIINCDPCEKTKVLEGISFIDIQQETGVITFKSDSFRKFVKDKLNHLKETINQLIVDDFLSQPDSPLKLTLLPTFLEESGKHELLLNYLSPEYFSEMVNHCQSLVPLKQTADMGIRTAMSRRSDIDLMRLGLQRTLITELDQGEINRAEIEALMALSDEETAFSLAQSSVTNEERLHALAIIARHKKEQGLTAEPEINKQIKQTYNNLNLDEMGDKAYDIAEALVRSNPDMAVELVEKASAKKGSSLDLDLAKLSFLALDEGNFDRDADSIKTVGSKIRDPRIKKFLSSLSFLLGDYSAKELLNELSIFDTPSDIIFFSKEWLKANKERDDAFEVIEKCLDIIIKTTEYTPTAKDFRELAIPLPFIKEESKRTHLVSIFDGQKGVIEKLGPTEEIIKLELLIAHTEFSVEQVKGCNRFVDIYLKICAIDDILLKTICLSLFITSLAQLDENSILESKESLVSLSKSEFMENLKLLLSASADHNKSTRDILKPIAKQFTDLSFDIAMTLNIQEARDNALQELIQSNVRNTKQYDFNFYLKCYDEISDYIVRDQAVASIIEHISLHKSVDEKTLNDSLCIINKIDSIQNFAEKCRLYCLVLPKIANQNYTKYEGLINHILHQIDDSWNAIDESWVKIKVGFNIVNSLALFSLEKAKSYYQKVDIYRNGEGASSFSFALNYLSCLLLAVRAFNGLIPQKLSDLCTKHRLSA
jgi:AAA domain